MSASVPIAAVGDGIGKIGERHWAGFLQLMLHGPHTDRDDGFLRLVTGAPHPFANFALVLNPADIHSTKVAMQKLLGCTAPTVMMYVGRAPSSVNELLVDHGFEAHPSMPAMAVEIEKLPDTCLPSGYSFVRVGPGPSSREWAECFVAGFEFPSIMGDVISPEVVGPDPSYDAAAQFFAIVKDGRTVNTSMLFLDAGVAGIYCVSTIPEERGKGLAAHATAAALRQAQQFGYRVGVLQATPIGFSVYQRLGFHSVGEIPLYVRMNQA